MTMEEVMKGDFEHMIRSKGMVDGVLVDIILDRQINGMFRYAVRITRTDGTYGYSYKPFDTLFFAKRYFDRLLKENPGVVRMKKKDCRKGHLLVWDMTTERRQYYKCRNCGELFYKVAKKPW